MPLASIVQAAGIALLGAQLGPFHAAQLVVILFAGLVPLATYLAARSLGVAERGALLAAFFSGMGGLFAPAWVTLDSYGLAALLGTLFFLSFARAAATGDARAGALAGLAIGLLFLARAEAALLGLAPLALAAGARTRAAGVAGSALALAIGIAWLARNAALGPSDLLARSALLVRYEDLFAQREPTLDAFLAAGPAVVAARAGALGANAITFLFAFALLPVVGMVTGARALWPKAEVRAYVALALLVFLAQSLVWTLHSTRGSYVHSLAAFLPFGFALAAAGGQALLDRRAIGVRTLALAAALAGCLAMSIAALVQFDATYGATERARRAALDAVPAGPFLAIDASAWRWIADRPVVVTPADGLEAAACAVGSYGARAVVLEPAHFSAYDQLYQGSAGVPWLGPPIDRGGIRIYPVRGEVVCTPRRVYADTVVGASMP
ncbi:MAG TPA: hypothetical protein VGR87_13500 [Candidatus Limnocylindria bacterium]|jgi:hypothetical protein|nr:hypothetical protein [Candidatus Limnocylindria bacterium]